MADVAEMIERHLSADEMKEIASQAWREMCSDYFLRAGASVAIANVAYPIVRKAIEEAVGGNADGLIAAKAVEIINDLSAYTVFHAPSIYDAAASPAWKLLQRVVAENEGILRDRVQHHLHNLSKADALEIIKSAKLTIQTGGGA